MRRGWLVFGALGVVATVLAWIPIVRAIAGGYLFAYPPLAHLQLAIGVLSLVPCLALSRAMQAHLAHAHAAPGGRILASRILASWCASLAMLLTGAPGMLFVEPRIALLALATVVALQHVVQWKLVGMARATRASWLLVSLAGITPPIANTIFALAFAY